MEPSTTNKIRRPLGDLTNTISQGNQDNHGSPQAFLDPIARKRHRDRERYASMSAEKKNERNRKARERRRENRQRNDQNPPIANQEGDTCVPVDQDENNEWLHRGSLHENNDPTHVAAHHPDGDDLLTSGQYTLADMGDSCIEGCASPVGHGDNFKYLVVLCIDMLHPHELHIVKPASCRHQPEVPNPCLFSAICRKLEIMRGLMQFE